MKEKKRKTQAANRKENEIDDTQARKETHSDVTKAIGAYRRTQTESKSKNKT